MKIKTIIYALLILIIMILILFGFIYFQKINSKQNSSKIKDLNSQPNLANNSLLSQTDLNIKCSKDDDCGGKAFILYPFCENERVMQYMVNYACNKPGTTESYCTNTTTLEIRYDCPSFKNICYDAQCVTCVPRCSGKQCGSNGCGGLCGNCETGKNCDSEGKCR